MIDPISGEIIPRDNIETPGILSIWNPYTICHLQALKSEDMLQLAEIAKTMKNVPPYLENKGLQFVGRVAGAKEKEFVGKRR